MVQETQPALAGTLPPDDGAQIIVQTKEEGDS